jgi:eukaryotic-like serine/threonine-protein kinase
LGKGAPLSVSRAKVMPLSARAQTRDGAEVALNTSTTDWAQAFELLDEALELAPPARAEWLDKLGRERADMHRLVAELLEQRAEIDSGSFMKSLPQFSHLGSLVESEETTHAGLKADDAIGPYRLIRELGVGGMGAVWLAERADGALKRAVALKLPHPGPFQQQLAERFRRERDILASLTHPHIARLYDAGATAAGQPYLALEYVEGMPLNDYCARKKLGIPARLELFLQVLSAVQYAHTNLVLHRDLKPSNILVTADGSVQLLDFGIAKFMSGHETRETELTEMGGRALTPDYASPEQILGAPLSTASDVYSLGVILYELLSGARPYKLKRGTRGELEDAILATDSPRPSAALKKRMASSEIAVIKEVRELAGDLDVICLKALKKEPHARFPTVAAFAAEIERHRQNLPIETRSDSKLYTAQKFVSRHRTVVALSAFAVCALVVGMIAAVMQANRASHEAEIARAQSARAKAAEQFLAGLFTANSTDQADPQAGQRLTARDLLDRGAARIDQELTAFPDAKADVLNTLADMYVHLGEWDRALELNQERLKLVEKIHGKQSVAYAEALVVSAFRLNGARRYDAQVLQQTAEAKQILTASNHANTMSFGALLRMEATVLRNRDLDAAVESARRAVDIMRPLGDGSREYAKRFGNALADLGLTHAAHGNYVQAELALQEGYSVLVETIGRDNLDAAFVEVCWGTVDALRGNLITAEQRLREGAARVRRAGGATQPAGVFADSVLGHFLHSTSRSAEGLALIEDAQTRILRKHAWDHPRAADVTILLAEAKIADGRLDQAEALVAALAGKEAPYRASAETVLAKALLKQPNPDINRIEQLLGSAIQALEMRKARGSRWWMEATLMQGNKNLLGESWAAARADFGRVAAVSGESAIGPQFIARAELGLARAALAEQDATAARRHFVRAEAAANDARLDGKLPRLADEVARVRACLGDAEARRLSPKRLCPLP